MIARCLLILLVLASCSGERDAPVTKTLTVSAERLAEIKANPYVKRYARSGGPTARLAGLERDPWPAGILFLEMDPYLGDLGFDTATMIVAVDGKKAHDIFLPRWKVKGKRPAGFLREHYRDLIEYLFVESTKGHVDVTVYRDVPSDQAQLAGYTPRAERWRIKRG